MSKKAVFLDRDGTLIEDKGYISKCNQVMLLPGVIEALRNLKELGFELIIISNQSGIGRGLVTETQVEKINNYLDSLLTSEGINITDVYYCPHTPDDNCFCRKPKPGMILSALNKYDINAKESYFVGDKWTDVETAVNAGLSPVLISDSSEQVVKGIPVVIVDSILTWVESIK